MAKVFLGTSGNPPNFFDSEFKKDRLLAPLWINDIGLNAYEVLFTHGVKMTDERAKIMGANAKKNNIKLSVHAPYFVVLTSDKEDVVARSRERMKASLTRAQIMGATSAVVHPGYYKGSDPLGQLKKEFKALSRWKDDLGIKTTINPEVMGKKSQLGSVSEVLEMCAEIEGLAPCVDFGHLHARDNGFLQSEKEFRSIFEQIESTIGIKELRSLHCHFAPLEYNGKGEIRHRAHTERDYKPHPEPFCDLIKEFKMSPTIISESRDSQDTAAIEMREYFKKIGYWN